MMESYDAILDHAMVSPEPIYCFYGKIPSNKLWPATYKTIPSAGRSKFQSNVIVLDWKKAGYMMEKLT